MNAWRNHNFIYIAILAYAILWFVLHPAMAYLLDSDAVAYLTIAHRVADGDFATSVNGLWSPLNSWLLVPFIKMGMDSWLAAKVLNFFFGGVVLVQAYFLFARLNFESWIRNLLSAMLVIVICFYAYYQMFGDVLQLIFALGYVHLFVQKDFVLNRKLVITAALIMGVGFYAKSYSLVFFMVHFTALCFIAWKKNFALRSKVLANYLIGILLAVLIVLPWSFQLQKKYREFSLTGFAGKLNMSWYINSGKTFKDDIKLLIPPAHDDSPSFWEDPILSAGELSTPFSSDYHFKRWVLRVGHTCLIALKSALEISIFYIPIILFLLYRLYKRKKIPAPFLSILLAVLILPLGYLAMHIETRYIWLNAVLIMILGVYLIKEYTVAVKPIYSIGILGGSFLLMILFIELPDMIDRNKLLFQQAKLFTHDNIQGKIVSNIDDEGSFWVVSYLAGLNNYTIEKSEYSIDELAEEMNRYGVKYYWHCQEQGGDYNDDQELFKSKFELVFNSKRSVASLYKLKD